MTQPECVIVARFFVSGSELQIETTDGAFHLCQDVSRYDLDRLKLHMIRSSGPEKDLIYILTLKTESTRLHFTWTTASALSSTPLS